MQPVNPNPSFHVMTDGNSRQQAKQDFLASSSINKFAIREQNHSPVYVSQ